MQFVSLRRTKAFGKLARCAKRYRLTNVQNIRLFCSQTQNQDQQAKNDGVNSESHTDKIHNIVSQDILGDSTLSDPSHYTKEEQKVYQIVKNLIEKDFIDLPELYELASQNREKVIETSTKVETSPDSVDWNNIPSNVVNYYCLSKPIEFVFTYTKGDRQRTEACEITLDDRDIRHILIYLLKDCLITQETRIHRANAWNKYKRELKESMGNEFNKKFISNDEFSYQIESEFRTKYDNYLWQNVHPSVKELARLYNIKTLEDFREFAWKIADHSSYLTTKLLSSDIEKWHEYNGANNILENNNNVSLLTEKIFDNNQTEFNKFGQNKEQLERDMTTHELNVTLQRIQNLEWQQSPPPKRQIQNIEATKDSETNKDENFIDFEKYPELKQAIEITKREKRQERNESLRKRRQFDGEMITQDEYNRDVIGFDDVLNRISNKWNGDIRRSSNNLDDNFVSGQSNNNNSDKYIGGDWRVRLGIIEKPPKYFDIENESQEQWESQLQQGFQLTVKKRYKVSPFKIRSLPYDEKKKIEIDFRNVKFLNNFVNVRGMILPWRLTGVNPKHQKRISRAINRSKKMGFMPYMSKLIILDKDKIFDKRENSLIARFKYNERDFYDPLTIDDLKQLYPEYMNDSNLKNLQKQRRMNKTGSGSSSSNTNENEMNEDSTELVQDRLIDFRSLYDIKDSELEYQRKLKQDQTLFMKEIKQDIMQQLPQYWQNRIKFRNEQARIMAEQTEKRREKRRQEKLQQARERSQMRQNESPLNQKRINRFDQMPTPF